MSESFAFLKRQVQTGANIAVYKYPIFGLFCPLVEPLVEMLEVISQSHVGERIVVRQFENFSQYSASRFSILANWPYHGAYSRRVSQEFIQRSEYWLGTASTAFKQFIQLSYSSVGVTRLFADFIEENVNDKIVHIALTAEYYRASSTDCSGSSLSASVAPGSAAAGCRAA